jgi:predicted DNA-binding transcriptional regulator AlpA
METEMKKIPDQYNGLAGDVLSQNSQKNGVYQSQYGLKPYKATFTPFLTPKMLAAQIGVSVKTLDRWRKEGNGPAFHKITNKRIRYYLPDVDAWLAQKKSSPDTS